MAETNNLQVSPGPHISSTYSTQAVMRDVLIGLLPATACGIYFFRTPAVTLIAACIISCVLTEYVWNLIRKKPLSINDLSAVVTGLILAMSVPPTLNIGFAVIGSVFCIAISKMVYGGLGYNKFNPAMIGRAFLTACFGTAMTVWTVPALVNPEMPIIGPEATVAANVKIHDDSLSAITKATPLSHAKDAIKTKNETNESKIVKADVANKMLKASLFGYTGGCIGETSALALILGGIYMLIRRTITLIVPLTVLASAFAYAQICYWINGDAYIYPIMHLLSGGMLICAFFIATDPVTIPITRKGMAVFGVGVGFLIILIRTVGGYPEGVMYAILIMNAISPLIDRMFKITPVGGKPNA